MIMQEELSTYCPYCGENIQLLVDCSLEYQEYIEDCQVCCRPIQITATVGTDGIASVETKADHE